MSFNIPLHVESIHFICLLNRPSSMYSPFHELNGEYRELGLFSPQAFYE